MRRYLIPPLACIDPDHSWRVDGKPLVWVDGNTEQTRVGVDQLGKIPTDFKSIGMLNFNLDSI